LATPLGSVRHTVKSRVILAAALCSLGDVDSSRREAGDALRQAGASGLIPLRWAAACLLADLPGGEDSHPEVAAIRDDAAQTVTRRGGVWRSR
ncbi:MAG: hypothetical protein U1D00_00810, partial [Mycobacterium sp.]|nr:hypothetical protein [Mycobacterium sp.]